MISNPTEKYRRFPTLELADRQWPSRTIDQPPIWLATDLRDGNQALFEPMNPARKMRLFRELVRIGFKEVEVGFPAASQTDFDVVRELIEGGHVPADVTPMVMTQLREDLIVRTIEALRGAPRAIVHLYNATAPVWRRVVFGMSVPEMVALVERHVRLLRRLTDEAPDTQWILQYSPETFCMTELDVSLQVCNAAIRAWDAGAQRPMIVNLPTTVEVTTANVFADQIEWMHRHLERRAHVVLSVHPHNDRGTGVASAEQALMAGAQRIEGCLFGNGERSGNVDIVTLALNMYTQGVHPGLDFSDIASVARIAEECTSLPVHPRHPYAGDLVFTAFSGSHQDAIRKGFAVQAAQGPWEVPYLPIDPKDLGRTYDGIVRVNSQSGKGGMAFLLEREHGVVMPRRMQVEFSSIVQKIADTSEAEISAGMLWEVFEQTYLAPALDPQGSLHCRHHHLAKEGDALAIEIDLVIDGRARRVRGTGSDPAAAAVAALDSALRLDSHEERRAGAFTWVIVEMAMPGVSGTRFGVGRHPDASSAAVQAVVSAAARLKASPAAPARARSRQP